MYEQFSNEDNDKPAVDAQAALRLFLEAIDGPPPTTSRQGKDSLFGSKEAVASALAKSYLTPEKKSGESTGIDNLLADLAAAGTAASMLYMTGKNGPVQQILSKEDSITRKVIRSLEDPEREQRVQAQVEAYSKATGGRPDAVSKMNNRLSPDKEQSAEPFCRPEPRSKPYMIGAAFAAGAYADSLPKLNRR